MNYMKTDSDQKSKPKTTIVKSKKKKDPFVAGIATIIAGVIGIGNILLISVKG